MVCLQNIWTPKLNNADTKHYLFRGKERKDYGSVVSELLVPMGTKVVGSIITRNQHLCA